MAKSEVVFRAYLKELARYDRGQKAIVLTEVNDRPISSYYNLFRPNFIVGGKFFQKTCDSLFP
jgi:hypothetical protein